MDTKQRKAIHDDVRDSTIPEEMKLMYLMASACQNVVEHVFDRIKKVYRYHGYQCKENELLTGISDYCKMVKSASHQFYARISPQIEKATWGLGRGEDNEGNVVAYDGFNSASNELVRLMMCYVDGTADDDKAYAQVFRTLRKLPSKKVFNPEDISHFKIKM